MSEHVDDFLEHYGIPGMKWGKKGSKPSKSTSKPKMSRKKKVAIAVGVGAVVAIGAAVAIKSVNKNSKLPAASIKNRPEVKKGEQAFNKAVPTNSSRPVNNAGKPKPPSPYPMTPLIKTPILDEINKKYNLAHSDLVKAIMDTQIGDE